MKKLSVCLCAMFLIFGIAGAADALTIFEDNFNDINVVGSQGLNYNSFTNWDVTDGTVDVIGEGTNWNFFPTQGYGKYIDMDGSTGNAGIMTATFYLDPGEYVLQFDLAGNQRNAAGEIVTVAVQLGMFEGQYSLSIKDPFQTFSESFIVTSGMAASLSFAGSGGDNIGMLLDNVVLSKTNPTPEPATLVLLGIGLIGLTGLGRIRTKT